MLLTFLKALSILIALSVIWLAVQRLSLRANSKSDTVDYSQDLPVMGCGCGSCSCGRKPPSASFPDSKIDLSENKPTEVKENAS